MFASPFTDRWTVRPALATAAGLVMLAGTVLAGAVPASAATRPVNHAAAAALTLAGDGVKVRTANGQAWILSVQDANRPGALSFSLYRGTSTAAEEHTWHFASQAASLTFYPSSGTASVMGRAATGQQDAIDLGFTALSHRAASCVSGSETDYFGALHGAAVLATGLTAGGTVGSRFITFNAKGYETELSVDHNCVPEPTADGCTAATSWYSGGPQHGAQAAGLSGPTASSVSVLRTVQLSKPHGATRDDLALVQAAAPNWNRKTHVLSVRAATSGLVTGSATLSGGRNVTTSRSCTWRGKTYTLTNVANSTARYHSPAGQAVTAHTALTGTLTAPATASNAGFSVTTVS